MTRISDESGIALVSVLIVIAVAGFMVASAVSMSQYGLAETATFSAVARSRYHAEGAANRAICLLNDDLRSFPGRKLGDGEVYRTGHERYLADGVVHRLDYYGSAVEFQIFDAVSGIDAAGGSPERLIVPYLEKDETEQQAMETIRNFSDELLDYTDQDSFVRPRGLEKMHYRGLGLPALPRNGRLQFREELRYLPTAPLVLPEPDGGRYDIMRLIPPEGMPALSGRPSLFPAVPALLRKSARLSDGELEQVGAALEAWRDKRVPLYDSLAGDLLSRLEIAFSLQESGFYTIRCRVGSPDAAGSQLSVTLAVSAFAKKIEFYEFVFY